jgi:hypothetical protein
MDQHRPKTARRRGVLAGVLSAAALAIALPASGAFADSGSSEPAAGSSGTQSAVQSQEQPTPRDGDCPERGGSEAPSGESVEL